MIVASALLPVGALFLTFVIGTARENPAAGAEAGSPVWQSSLATLFVLGLVVAVAVALGRKYVAGPIERLAEATDRLARGDASVNPVAETSDELGRMAGALGSVAQNLREQVDLVGQVAAGDLSVVPTPRSDADVLARSTTALVLTLRNVTSEVSALVNEASQGHLEACGRADRLRGAWRELVEGCNRMLAAIRVPVTAAEAIVDKISRGEIPPAITEEYPGEFERIKQCLNRCIAAMEALRVDVRNLCKASLEGRLSFRADPSKHLGFFQKTVFGINEVMDSITRPINDGIVILERIAEGDLSSRMEKDYQGEHARIKQALNQAVTRLDEGMQQVAVAIEAVAAAAEQISGGSQAIAQGASEQAASIEEISSSLQAVSYTHLTLPTSSE
ncbi:MAG: HAMP domain-containing protein, partial [Candidatus Eisenbacteria bacterium]|nr:HAMP domain-containing protein [Candidatus Eisenbacteria bacterium]